MGTRTEGADERYTQTRNPNEHLIMVHRERYLGHNLTIHNTKFTVNLNENSIFTPRLRRVWNHKSGMRACMPSAPILASCPSSPMICIKSIHRLAESLCPLREKLRMCNNHWPRTRKRVSGVTKNPVLSDTSSCNVANVACASQ